MDAAVPHGPLGYRSETEGFAVARPTQLVRFSRRPLSRERRERFSVAAAKSARCARGLLDIASGACLFALLLASTAAAPVPGLPPVSPPATAPAVEPSDAAPPAPAPPSAGAVAAQAERLAADPSLDAGQREEGKKLLEQAAWLRESADAEAAKAAEYRQALTDGASRAAALRAQADALAKRPTTNPATNPSTRPTTAPTGGPAVGLVETVDAAERQLAASQGRAETLRGEVAELKVQAKLLADRPAAAADELAAARAALDQAERASTDPPENADGAAPPPALAAARQAKADAWRAEAAARVEQLRQEVASREPRTDLLAARRDLAAAKLARADEAAGAWQKRVAQLRSAEAASATAEARRLRDRAADESPAVKAVALENARASDEFADAARDLAAATRRRQQASAETVRVESRYERAQEKLEVSGMEDELGDILRQERKALPNPFALRRDAADTAQSAAKSRLMQMQAEDRLSSLSDLAAATDAALTGAAAMAPDDASKRRDQITALLTSRRDLLTRLADEYARESTEQRGLATELTRLADKTEKYANLLDERLLWSRSAAPIGPEWVADVASSSVSLARGFVSPQTPLALWHRFRGTVLLTLFVGLSAAALLAARPRLRKRMALVNENVGKVYADRFSYTLRALLLTLALAAPWPMVWGYAGWLLRGDVAAPEAVRALGAGLQSAGLLILLLGGLRVMCREQGVADVHLGWPADKRRLLAVNAGWLLAVLLPSSIVVPATEFLSDEVARNGLGRGAFIVGSALLGVFGYRLLKFNGGLVEPRAGVKFGGWIWRMRHVWFALGVGGPLALGVLAAVGYYYSALAVESRLFQTMGVVIGASVLYSLAVRWLLVARRKLAVRRAREKRDALAAANAGKRAGDASGDATPVNVEVPTVDITAVDEQARELLRVMTFAALAVGFYFVWRDLVPALGVLDQVRLWSYSAVNEKGVETLVPLTLGRLGVAAAVAALTVVAARNLPGVLEIAVLQRLSLDPANRYAITSVSLYAIVAVGILTVTNLLGVGWGNVQWLVAALSVGLGFGLQEIVANFVSGVIVLFEQPIRVGDTVTVGSLSGTVSRIRIRATTITDFDNKELIVPNKTFITEQLTNWTLSDTTTRLVVKVGVSYDIPDPAAVHQLILDVGRAHPLVLDNPAPTAFFMGFGESSLDFELRVFVRETGNRLAVLNAINGALFRALGEAGIEIPFPQRDLHVRSVSEAIPFADRTRPAEHAANGAGNGAANGAATAAADGEAAQ